MEQKCYRHGEKRGKKPHTACGAHIKVTTSIHRVNGAADDDGYTK